MKKEKDEEGEKRYDEKGKGRGVMKGVERSTRE